MVVKKDSRESRVARDRLRAYEARQELHTRLITRRKRDNLFYGLAAAVVIVLAIGSQVVFATSHEPDAAATAVPTASSTPDASSVSVPSASLAENRVWTGVMTVNGIPLGVELNGVAAPQAVASTISLATSGFYDGSTCHRLTTEGIWVLQCGDPNGDGSGGPGYSYGPVENAPSDNIYPAGTLAMARQSDNASSMGSQFFIVYRDSPIPADAAGGYTVIGRITSGLDALQAAVIAQGTVDGASDGSPKVPTRIDSFLIQ